MPQLHDVEIWDSTNENLLATFTGTSSLCDAAAYTLAEEAQCNLYYYNGLIWLQWVGPRPQNPPGR